MNSFLTCFFFSSRRRHTRLQGDWSSDVCSSDLLIVGGRHFEKGIGMPTNSEIEFELNATYDNFVALVGIDDEFNNQDAKARSEERRVGKEGRSRWSPYQ